MKKRFLAHISLLLLLFGIILFNNCKAYSADTYSELSDSYQLDNQYSNTFDIKKVAPEIVVIVIAGGVLLFCISKES